MKRFLILAIIAVTLVACNKDDEFVPNADINKRSLQFAYSGGVDSFAITSNTNWIIEENVDWITLSVTSGNGDAVIRVNVAVNATAQRSATITVRAEGLAGIEITVTQSKTLETVGLYILSEGAWGEGNANISYYDVKTGQLSRKFSEVNSKALGDGANCLAIYGSKLYCVVTGGSGEPSETDGYIEVINPETGMSLSRIPIEEENGDNSRPRRIIFHEGKAYVTTYSQSVIRIDTASLAIDGKATLSGTFAEGISLYNNNLYICNSGQGSGNTISIVNLGSFTETATISVPQNPVMIETTSSGDIYFTTSTVYENWVATAPSNIHILDPVQKQVTRTFDINASSIALTNDFIYAIDFDWNDFSDHISKINLQTKVVSDIIDIYEEYMMVYSVSANPLTGDIYLGNAGDEVVAFDKDGNEKFSLETGIPYILKVVPVFK